MATEYVTKTVKEIFEALAKNGFEHLRGQWFSYMDSVKPGACILGQGAINLGVIPYNIFEEGETSLLYGEDLDDREDFIIAEGSDEYTILGQLNHWQVPPTSRWYVEYTDHGLGSVIMYWNDKENEDERGDHYDENDNHLGYILATYKDVINMAREILEPHFNEEVKLAVYDYQMPEVGSFVS